MHFTLYTFKNGQATVFPTTEEILDLKIGDWVFDCFGRAAKVVEILGRGLTYVSDRPFVMVYLEFGHDSRIDACFTADTFDLTVGLRYPSDDLMTLQRQARLERQVQL